MVNEPDAEQYVVGVVVFGPEEMRVIRGHDRKADFFGELENPAVQIILPLRVVRLDLERQALSKAPAVQTNFWKVQEGKGPQGEPRFDANLIEQCLREGEQQEKSWDCFFQRTGVSPFRVEYEKLCEDYETTIRDVLDFLKISLPRRVRIGTPVTIKQSDETSYAWEERFLKHHYAAFAQS